MPKQFLISEIFNYSLIFPLYCLCFAGQPLSTNPTDKFFEVFGLEAEQSIHHSKLFPPLLRVVNITGSNILPLGGADPSEGSREAVRKL